MKLKTHGALHSILHVALVPSYLIVHFPLPVPPVVGGPANKEYLKH